MGPDRHFTSAARNIVLKITRRALRVHKPVVRAARRAERAGEHLRQRCEELQVEREIAAVARGRAPIVAGPWLGEVGYEALYWVPFLRWFEDAFRIDPERVVVVSRGGVESWYAALAGRYIDLFDYFTPDGFARRNATRRGEIEGGGQKQSGSGAFDREILARVRTEIGSPDIRVFHPVLLFRLFKQFWLGNRSIDYLWQHTRFQLYSPPSPVRDLPAGYVAVKFYAGTALPDSVPTRRALRTLVERVAERRPVVVLDSGVTVDEHEEYLFAGIPNVRTLRGTMHPRVNLGIQTEVLAGARQFIGTCGSLAWLAPMFGVPTIGVFMDDRLLTPHLLVARHAYRVAGAARFAVLDLRAADRLHLLDRP